MVVQRNSEEIRFAVVLYLPRGNSSRLVVFDNRKWIVEVMKLLLPLLKGRGLPESYGERFEIFPLDEQEIAPCGFKTALQLVR